MTPQNAYFHAAIVFFTGVTTSLNSSSGHCGSLVKDLENRLRRNNTEDDSDSGPDKEEERRINEEKLKKLD